MGAVLFVGLYAQVQQHDAWIAEEHARGCDPNVPEQTQFECNGNLIAKLPVTNKLVTK